MKSPKNRSVDFLLFCLCPPARLYFRPFRSMSILSLSSVCLSVCLSVSILLHPFIISLSINLPLYPDFLIIVDHDAFS